MTTANLRDLLAALEGCQRTLEFWLGELPAVRLELYGACEHIRNAQAKVRAALAVKP